MTLLSILIFALLTIIYFIIILSLLTGVLYGIDPAHNDEVINHVFTCADCKRKFWGTVIQETIEKNKETICIYCRVGRTQRDIFNKFELQKSDTDGNLSIVESDDTDGRVSVIEEESKSESNKNEPK